MPFHCDAALESDVSSSSTLNNDEDVLHEDDATSPNNNFQANVKKILKLALEKNTWTHHISIYHDDANDVKTDLSIAIGPKTIGCTPNGVTDQPSKFPQRESSLHWLESYYWD